MNSSYMNISLSTTRGKSTSFNTTSHSIMNASRLTIRGNQSMIMSSHATHCLEPFGEKLPSMIKSILSNIPEIDKVSCRIDPNGWAWIVCGRKLYIWKYNYGSNEQKRTSTCRELSLPPSELIHHAQLICILANKNNITPACIAVSPEGHITYWPNVAKESAYIELSADIPGQECDFLYSLWPTGCILATTSGTVLLIKPTPGGGNKTSLSCIPLSIQKGWLGGIGRKVSNILFTPMAGSTGLDAKKAMVAIPMTKDDLANPGAKNSTVYVLTGPCVQTWSVSSEKQIFSGEINVEDHIRSFFHDHIPELQSASQERRDVRGIQIWMLNITTQADRIIILAAALNTSETNQNPRKKIYYGIATFHPRDSRVKGFAVVDHATPYETSVSEDELYSWKLWATPSFYFMSSPDLLLIIGENTVDKYEAANLDGVFLGSGLANEVTLLVCMPRFGLMSLRSIMSLEGTYIEPRVPDHLALSMTLQNLEDLSSSEDQVNRYKCAFLAFIGKKEHEGLQVIHELFPPGITNLAPRDPVDVLSVALCVKLIDDSPQSDPRWARTFGRPDIEENFNLKSKMLIRNFLEEKKTALELYFNFLKHTGLRSRLSSVAVDEDVYATPSILYNCYEKVGFAMALQNLQSSEKDFRPFIDASIKALVDQRAETGKQIRSSHLTCNDLFYKDVSSVEEFFVSLVEIECEQINRENASEGPKIVGIVNKIITKCYADMFELFLADKIIAVNEILLHPMICDEGHVLEIKPWITMSPVLQALKKQQKIIVRNGVKETTDLDMKVDLLKDLTTLTDIILNAVRMNLESMKKSERYTEKYTQFEKIRLELLRVFLEVKDFDGASILAEKYLDFEILLAICYDQKDFKRLEEYFDRFHVMSFDQFAFTWFIRNEKASELVDIFSKNEKVETRLRIFLNSHPQILWHHHAVNDQYYQSSDVLMKLAKQEESSLDDKKFYLCLSKLALLSDEMTTQIEQANFEINKELALVENQNQIKIEALEAYGFDKKDMRVLTPSEIIDVYTLYDGEVTPEEFLKALALCDKMPTPEMRLEKRLYVVGRAILRDPWATLTSDYPVDVIKTTLLYKLVTLAISLGEDLEDAFPIRQFRELDIIQDLISNPNAMYLLKACYEHISTEIAASRDAFESLRNQRSFSERREAPDDDPMDEDDLDIQIIE